MEGSSLHKPNIFLKFVMQMVPRQSANLNVILAYVQWAGSSHLLLQTNITSH